VRKATQATTSSLVYMLRAINGFALSVDGVALLNDRSYMQQSTDNVQSSTAVLKTELRKLEWL